MEWSKRKNKNRTHVISKRLEQAAAVQSLGFEVSGSVSGCGVLAPSSKALVASLLLVAMPFVPSSVLAPSSDALCS